jgi:protein Tex
VTNVAAFGAFVDIGVHQDGLIHVSQLSDQFVKNPADIVKVQQKVQVTVLEIDLVRKRISLSMKSRPEINRAEPGKSSGKAPRSAESAKPSTPFGGDWFNQALSKK